MKRCESHIRTHFTFVAEFNSWHTLLHAVHLWQREEEHHQGRPPDTGEPSHPDLVETLMSAPLPLFVWFPSSLHDWRGDYCSCGPVLKWTVRLSHLREWLGISVGGVCVEDLLNPKQMFSCFTVVSFRHVYAF